MHPALATAVVVPLRPELAAEIRASTQEQAASVEEQLAAVQETAATVDEITHSGGQIGKRAQEVIASAQANMFVSIAGGINALAGPLHGGAN